MILGVCASALLAATLVSHAPKAQENAVSSLEKEAIGAAIREYLLENPEVVIEAIEAYQSNQKEREAQQFVEKVSSFEDELYNSDMPFAGNPDGDVTVVEFFDYNCGYCKKAMPDVQAVLQDDDNVKVIFFDMPILSQSSQEASRYALAAQKQGKYFEYHVALMEHPGSKNTRVLESIAEDVGLDVEKLRKDANDKETRQIIEQNLSISRELGIRGTPAFIIGDMLAPGYMGVESMKQAIADARDEG